MMFRRKLFLCILFYLPSLFCRAQEFNSWYFGNGAGISFNPGGASNPHSVPDGVNPAYEGNASISDSNGTILFYTNGTTVYNRLHQVMLNGDGLFGHQSSAQSSIIVPLPNSDSIYYIFTTDASENNFANGYRYSIVNSSRDGGKGEVITKNVLLNASCTERLTAFRHANGIDVWIMGNERNSNVFKCWRLTCNGLQTSPVISVAGVILKDQDLGMMKTSPDGKFLCQTNYPDAPGNFFQLFDLDNATGTISNPRTITNDATSYFDCEFSPNSKLLYVTRAFEKFIDQFDVTMGSAASINATRISIPAIFGFYGIQTGPDGKIYLNRYKTKLSVINNPDIAGPACDFVLDAIDLGGRSGVLGLPNPINDEPVNPFNNFSFQVTDSCAGTVQFNGITNLAGTVTWRWDFGDGNTSAIQSPSHTFSQAGIAYKVRLTITSSAVCGKIKILKYVASHGAVSDAGFDFVAKCDSGYVRFVNTSTIFPDNPVTYLWDFGDGETSIENSPIHVYATSGVFPVKLKMQTGLGCLDDSTTKSLNLQQLDIHAQPPSIQIDIGQPVQLNVTGGGTHFKWTPATWLSDATIANPVATPLDDILYKVVVTNDAGCLDEDSVFIKLNAPNDIFVPSAFTPNGDGRNDLFKPFIGRKYTLLDFTIYNRWGQKIFTAKNDSGWDGSIGGQAQNNGTYVWTLNAKDEQGKLITKKGTVIIIR